MRIRLFYHSLLSDWNHGNAHFLRGIATELIARGHDVKVYEPDDSWSRRNLIARHGAAAARELFAVYPSLRAAAVLYRPAQLDLDQALDGADLVLVHEWNPPELVAAIGRRRRGAGFRLFFHDTHHRAVTEPRAMAVYDLRDYDGVLAFGEVLSEIYHHRGWARSVWTWHEAADTRVFRPLPRSPQGEVVWIGNWGDGERADELRRYLLEPVQRLGLRATLHGVRWPAEALEAADAAGARYRGWLPNYRVPETFGAHRVTVHVPRGPYARALHGIPTIRPFEAMACGIPLLCSPWQDSEGLFEAGTDYLLVKDGGDMVRQLRAVLNDAELAGALARNGRARILGGHTCAHRVEQLLAIHASRSAASPARPVSATATTENPRS